MAKKNIEVTLVSVDLASPGTAKKKETRHALTAALVWPRLSVAKKESALPCTLAKGAADLSAAPWHETVLFKESVEGTFGFRAEVSEPLSDEALDSFLRAFAGIFLKDIGTAVGKADLVLGDILSAFFTTAGKKAGTAPKAELVAEGAVTLDAASLKDGDLFTVPLVAPRALVETSVGPNPGDRGTAKTRKTLVKKGAPNGTATFRVHLL